MAQRPLIPKSVKRQFKKIIQQLVIDLSQPLVIVQESPLFVDCPNCVFDSINKKSSNIFDHSFASPVTIFSGLADQQRTISPIPFTQGRCPVCVGEGQLFTNKDLCLPASIHYFNPATSRKTGGEFVDLPAGREGVNYAIVKTLACHYDLLARNSIFVIHNNIKCEKYSPPVVRGLGGDEAVAEMVLITTEAGQLTTGKFDSSDHPFNRNEDPRRKIKGPTDINVLRGGIRGRNS